MNENQTNSVIVENETKQKNKDNQHKKTGWETKFGYLWQQGEFSFLNALFVKYVAREYSTLKKFMCLVPAEFINPNHKVFKKLAFF